MNLVYIKQKQKLLHTVKDDVYSTFLAFKQGTSVIHLVLDHDGSHAKDEFVTVAPMVVCVLKRTEKFDSSVEGFVTGAHPRFEVFQFLGIAR